MNFYVFRRGDSRIAHFCAKDTLVFRDAEDVAPYKSCFEPHAKIHFPYQRNKKRAIFLIPCRGATSSTTRKKKVYADNIFTRKRDRYAICPFGFVLLFCKSDSLARPLLVDCGVVPKVDKRKRENSYNVNPLRCHRNQKHYNV